MNKVRGLTENGAKFGLERRAKGHEERAKRKTELVVFGALSLVLSLDEQRKNEISSLYQDKESNSTNFDKNPVDLLLLSNNSEKAR